jgi:hypothetical protein
VKASTELKGHTAEVSGVRWDPTHPEHLASCSASMGAGECYSLALQEENGCGIGLRWLTGRLWDTGAGLSEGSDGECSC